MSLTPPKSYTDTISGLRDGYGVEDIAVRSGHDVTLIRAHVATLRRNGVLADLVSSAP